MLDDYERKILKTLQRHGRASTQDLSDTVGLSSSPCWRRVKRLEDDGYIKHYAAVLDGKKLGLHAVAYVQVSLMDHTEQSIKTFEHFIQGNDQVLECASITGDFDFLLKVVATDPEALEDLIMRDILRLGVVRTTATKFVLRQIKTGAALPISIPS